MKFFRAAPAVLCMAFLGAALSPNVNADDRNKKTRVTFSAPVEIPGVHLQGWGVLPAGTYVFKLAESSSNRHIVQIFNKDETKIYATILAVPNYRLVARNKTVITFNEGLKGKPESLRAWFYPGANWGEEFVYPKAKAIELAKVTNLPVLAVVTEVKVEVTKPEELVEVVELKQAPIMAVKPTGEVVEIAQVIQTEPAPAVRVAASPEPTLVAQATLPATASSLPLFLLLGLLMFGGGFTVRAVANRTK